MNNKTLLQYILFLLAVVALAPTYAKDTAIPNAMIGHWEGNTKVIVQWCEQNTLPITIDVSPDGTVTGIIGDAKLTNANLKKKSNWFGAKTGTNTTHIITGKLEGDIVKAEGIFRDKVFVHVRIEDATLKGSLATNGAKIGGKESMILTTTSLRLSKNNQ